ncbi:hypothetical protein IW137_001942 [Coemansia sp. RSA 1287]|nr:hypothetical protein GGH98_002311 [Coemansia sp. RSA 454]KAJ2645115.1 hypothetical protein IW137_001942 [Coemansia sp. RSA 1287]
MSALEEISAILEHRATATQSIEYLVQWASDQVKTWEPSHNLTKCAPELTVYWRKHVAASRGPYLEAIIIKPKPSARQPANKLARAANSATDKPSGRSAKKARVVNPVSDRIAVAKRVQANKQLRGSLARAIPTGASGSMAEVPLIKPPPNAKRSREPVLSPVSETASMVENLVIRPIQRARKSTGRRPNQT